MTPLLVLAALLLLGTPLALWLNHARHQSERRLLARRVDGCRVADDGAETAEAADRHVRHQRRAS